MASQVKGKSTTIQISKCLLDNRENKSLGVIAKRGKERKKKVKSFTISGLLVTEYEEIGMRSVLCTKRRAEGVGFSNHDALTFFFYHRPPELHVEHSIGPIRA